MIPHLTEKGLRTHRRARALASVCHEWHMKACNTFPHRGPWHGGFQNGSFSPEFHDSWTGSSYSKSGVKKQMDFICASHTLDTSTYVLYGIDCGSDHKLLVCSCSVDLAGTGAAVPNRPCTPQASANRRQKSTKGWRPENPSAATELKEMMSDLPHGACVQDIQNRFASALSEVPFEFFPKGSQVPSPRTPGARRCTAAPCTAHRPVRTPSDKSRFVPNEAPLVCRCCSRALCS